jgi:hypothetical protein
MRRMLGTQPTAVSTPLGQDARNQYRLKFWEPLLPCLRSRCAFEQGCSHEPRSEPEDPDTMRLCHAARLWAKIITAALLLL